ncbi:MAG: DedA family protein [Gammaproteobacteria bacterium]|nr:DedA family protein [Gammaproteobacteria bacterium]
MTEWFIVSENFSLWSLFLSAFLSSTLLPGSSEALLVVYLEQGFEPYSLLTVATVGNTLGGLTSWLLGYWLIKKYPNSIPEKLNTKSIERIRRWGWPVLLFSWLPVIGDPLCLAAGWLRLNFYWSLLAIMSGKLIRYSAIALIMA